MARTYSPPTRLPGTCQWFILLGMMDLNHRIRESKSLALPLGESPILLAVRLIGIPKFSHLSHATACDTNNSKEYLCSQSGKCTVVGFEPTVTFRKYIFY